MTPLNEAGAAGEIADGQSAMPAMNTPGSIDSVSELRVLYAPAKGRAVTKQLDRLDPHCLRFIGLSPFGSLLAGWLAKVTSAAFTVTLGASICIVAGLIVLWIMTPQAEGAK